MSTDADLFCDPTPGQQFAFRVGANVWQNGAPEYGMGCVRECRRRMSYRGHVYLVRFETGLQARVEESALTPD